MNATIRYDLSEEGRRGSLLSGGNGHEEQTVTVEIVTIEDARLCGVGADGTAHATLRDYYLDDNVIRQEVHTADAPLTPEQALEHLRGHAGQCAVLDATRRQTIEAMIARCAASRTAGAKHAHAYETDEGSWIVKDTPGSPSPRREAVPKRLVPEYLDRLRALCDE